jgi:hypothetical protein
VFLLMKHMWCCDCTVGMSNWSLSKHIRCKLFWCLEHSHIPSSQEMGKFGNRCFLCKWPLRHFFQWKSKICVLCLVHDFNFLLKSALGIEVCEQSTVWFQKKWSFINWICFNLYDPT